VKFRNKMLLGTAIGVGILGLSAAGASAAVVCSGNVCWHTTERYEYPPEARIVVHEDDWKPHADARITFREHVGRGYWHEDKWKEW
jgi:hypothetical protein